MKKLLSLLIAILMMALPIACAEESAPAAEESAVPEEGGWLEATLRERKTRCRFICCRARSSR